MPSQEESRYSVKSALSFIISEARTSPRVEEGWPSNSSEVQGSVKPEEEKPEEEKQNILR